MRFLLLACMVVGFVGCGDDGLAGDLGVGADQGYCFPDRPTCTTQQCGMPCNPAQDTTCSDHGCFEGYNCTCNASGTWHCAAGVDFCRDMAVPLDLTSTTD